MISSVVERGRHLYEHSVTVLGGRKLLGAQHRAPEPVFERLLGLDDRGERIISIMVCVTRSNSKQ